MDVFEAFIGSASQDLFASVAAPADASELVELDVPEGQHDARSTIRIAISNAVTCKANPGLRIALIKGEAGSGKTHVLTTAFGYAAQNNEVFPVIVQLVAPVSKDNYDVWLLDALIRELESRHFPDANGLSPLRRLTRRLLEFVDEEPREALDLAIEEDNDDEAIRQARVCARMIRRNLEARLNVGPPGAPTITALLLAGLGNSAALDYLRRGEVPASLASVGLQALTMPTHRLALLGDIGRAAQGVGCAIAIGLDQVENIARLGDSDLFVHALTQAVRVAEAVPNAAIVIAVLTSVYDQARHAQLLQSDRHRIEDEGPAPVILKTADPELIRNVVGRRLALMRQRTSLPSEGSISLEPLPDWFTSWYSHRSVRAGLLEVNRFRMLAARLKRLPRPEEFGITDQAVLAPGETGSGRADYDKLWEDFKYQPAVRERLLPERKADLLAWWATESSQESTSGGGTEVNRDAVPGPDGAPVVDILLVNGEVALERRRVAICEAPNRNGMLLRQIDKFLNNCDSARPAILRTNGFPSGSRTQPAPAIRRVRDCDGFVLSLSESEWHLLVIARAFASKEANQPSFAEWRRERQWLFELLPPIRVLLEPPLPQPPTDSNSGTAEKTVTASATVSLSGFPVYIGETRDQIKIFWDPYRESAPRLNNFGFLVTGDAGSGKTQTICVLIDAAVKAKLPVLIFDFKNDYAPSDFAEPLGLEVVDVHDRGLPFNPLRPPPHGASGAKPIDHAFEISGILKRVYGLGPLQENALRDAVCSTYTKAGIGLRDWVQPSSRPWPSFEEIGEVLQEDQRRNAALIARLAPLFQLGLFPHDSQAVPFETMLTKTIVLKLNELQTDLIKAALAELVIIQLHGHALRGEQPRRLTRLMVFDEAHRIARSPRLETLGREGRAFGVGIVLGTQYPGDIPEATAGALATQLFLFNNQADHRRHVVRQVLGTAAGAEAQRILERLSELEPGEGLFVNPHHNRVFVAILPHWKR